MDISEAYPDGLEERCEYNERRPILKTI